MWFDKLFTGLASQTATGLVNNALARRPAQEQRDWQEKMWHQQNAYNTPSAMAGRMRAAGLNPYVMTGAQPAGSAGSGVKADFIPLQDPLSVTRQLADIENIRAVTGKTLSETEKLIQEASNLELAFEKGLIEKDEFEFRFNKLKEAWNEKNPYKLEAENKEADTAFKEAQASESFASADYLNTLSSKVKQETNLILEEIHSLQRQNLLGDTYDETLKQYELMCKGYDADVKSNASKYAKVSEYALNNGIDLSNLDPVYLPIVLPFMTYAMDGKVSDKQLTDFKANLYTILGDDAQNHRNAVNPDYIDDSEIEYFNHLRRQYNMQLKRLSFDIATATNQLNFQYYKSDSDNFTKLLTGIVSLVPALKSSSPGFDYTNNGNYDATVVY